MKTNMKTDVEAHREKAEKTRKTEEMKKTEKAGEREVAEKMEKTEKIKETEKMEEAATETAAEESESMSYPEKIRKDFAEGDARRDAGLSTPETIERHDDIAYGSHGVWNLLDVYHEKTASSLQPTIVSIHGGGWVYGTKEVYQYYCMHLAERGFTVVNFNYRLAPEDPYPAALEDINSVFCWIGEHAEEYHIDRNNLFVVGDSAGAQLASQYLAMFTNQEFGALYEFQVPVDKIQVRAAGLHCGVYDMKNNVEAHRDALLDAYLGKNRAEILPKLDTVKYVNSTFPPSFVMTAVHDFLRPHAEPFYKLLCAHHVPCELHEYGSEERTDIGHVFHVNIRLEEAKKCNDAECAFFRKFIIL